MLRELMCGLIVGAQQAKLIVTHARSIPCGVRRRLLHGAAIDSWPGGALRHSLLNVAKHGLSVYARSSIRSFADLDPDLAEVAIQMKRIPHGLTAGGIPAERTSFRRHYSLTSPSSPTAPRRLSWRGPNAVSRSDLPSAPFRLSFRPSFPVSINAPEVHPFRSLFRILERPWL